eukprot:3419750-Rhodomonas_salina.1
MTRKTGNEDLTKGIDYSGAVKQALLDSCQECPVFPVLLHQVCRHSANSDDPASVAADASARLCLYTTSASFALYLSFSLTPISLSLGTERCTKLGKHLSITRGKVKVTADEFSLSGASVPLLSTHNRECSSVVQPPSPPLLSPAVHSGRISGDTDLHHNMQVILHVYDLSGGLAKQRMRCSGRTPYGVPIERIQLGETQIPEGVCV